MKVEELTIDNQGTREWLEERLGKWTGSEIVNLTKKGRAKDEIFGDTAKSYIYKKMSERDLKDMENDLELWQLYMQYTNPSNKYMEFGSENEPAARFAYSEKTGEMVLTTGSIPHPTIKNFASSPDGCIADEDGNIVGCIEIKVPKPETFMRYKSEIKDNASLKSVEDKYYYQIQAHMMVTGASWCDFIAFCPFLNNNLHVVRIERDEDAMAFIEDRINSAEIYIENISKQ